MTHIDELKARFYEAKRNFDRARAELDEALKREREVPGALVAFLSELSRFMGKIPKRRNESEAWLTASQIAGYELPESFVNAFHGARLVQGIRAENDKLTGGTIGSLLHWIATNHSETRPLACDQAKPDTLTEHRIGDFVLRRRHDGKRLIRLRIERVEAPRPTNIVPLDEQARKGLTERANFLKT